jgi:endonuclease/exonuclease/phosphatase family metal-dependent hydrolase
MNELCRFLDATRPDVVALQEVSRVGARTQAEVIARKCDFDRHHYVESGSWCGREEGVAILTRGTSVSLPALRLPLVVDDMPRVLQRVEITRADFPTSIVVANTHLAFRLDARDGRCRQAQVIAGALATTTGPIATVLCGDLNDTPDSPAVGLLLDGGLGLGDTWRTARNPGAVTFAEENPWAASELGPGRRIDYIGCTEHFLVRRCDLVLTGEAGWGPVSDHYGVLVQLEPGGGA